YTVSAIDNNTCTNTATASVIVNPLPIITITSNSPVCDGKSITLTASAPNTNNYLWAGSSLNSPTYTTTQPVGTQSYSVTATDINGCSSTSSSTVTVNALPVVTITNNSPACFGS